MRTTRRLLSVLVAGALVGCQNGAGGSPPRRTATAAATPPAISAEESARVLDDYVRGHNRANGRPEPATGVLAETVRDAPAPPISLANPVMYVPRSDAYPRWFAAAALERQGRTERPVLMMFGKARAAGDWLPANRLYFTGAAPKIATDAEGYAVVVPSAAGGLVLSPAGVPVAQARYLDHGDRQKITPGGFATRWKATERGQEQGLRALGVSATGRSTPAAHSVYALRTTDGGALVWSALHRTVTYTAARPDMTVQVPEDVRERLRGRTGTKIVATWLWRSVTYVPAHGHADVVTQGADLTEVHAS